MTDNPESPQTSAELTKFVLLLLREEGKKDKRKSDDIYTGVANNPITPQSKANRIVTRHFNCGSHRRTIYSIQMR
jgi:hypothetical protein